MPYKDPETRRAARKRFSKERPWMYSGRRLHIRVRQAGGDLRWSDAMRIAKEVWLRDNGECKFKDDTTKCKGNICLHHLDGDLLNNDLNNLKLGCRSHHAKEHKLGNKIGPDHPR